MSKMIQVRHVPDELHRKLKQRAAAQGASLSEYLLKEIKYIAEQPTMDEWLARLETRTPFVLKEPVVESLHKARAGR